MAEIGLFELILGRIKMDVVTVDERSVRGEGFHRWLHTVVKVEEKCAEMTIRIEERLSRTVYVDMDQVRELRRLKVDGVPDIRGVGFTGGIDVEKPAEVSKEHDVVAEYFSRDVQQQGLSMVEVKYPVHFRYQKPEWNETFATALINPPTAISVKCDDKVFAFQSDDGAVGAIKVDIPIGLRKHEWFVHGTTGIVTVLASLLVSFVACRMMKRSNSSMLRNRNDTKIK